MFSVHKITYMNGAVGISMRSYFIAVQRKVVSSLHLHRKHTKQAILCLNYGFFVFFAERHKKHTLLTSIRFKKSSIGASSFRRSNVSARVDCIFSIFPMPIPMSSNLFLVLNRHDLFKSTRNPSTLTFTPK